MNSTRYATQSSKLRLALLLFLAMSAGACKRHAVAPQPRRQQEDVRALERKVERAIEDAGRSQVLIGPSPASPSAKPETPIEARAGAEVYAPVVAALRRSIAENRLDCAINESKSRQGWRTADIRISRHGKVVGRWKLREVRRILYAAIIIDDLGGNLEVTRRLLAMPYALTLSVLPHLRASEETAQEARRAGHEVMLHLPMQPEADSHASPGEGVIHVGLSGPEVERIIKSDLASVPHAAGVNNHMGSRATTDPRLMAAVMRSLAARHLYFIDSRTTAASVAFDAARRQGVPAFYRSIFLDDTETVPYTLGQLRKFHEVLEREGAALAIGHPYPSTIAALAQFLPELEGGDINLAPASHLLELPEVAHLKPPAPR